MRLAVREFTDDTFAGSRYAGELVRKRIEEALNRGEAVTLDFEGVSGVTQGFADEAIGVLVRAFGREALEKIRVINANDRIRLILNWVANYSLREEEPSADPDM